MKVENVSVWKLTPYARNPRRNDAAVNSVAASIKQFGFRNPIIVDKDGVIVSGHTRLKAAIMMGMETVPVVKIEDLSEDEINAFRLVDNKAQELSSWDFSLLMDELTAIEGIDMTDFGFAGLQDAEAEKQSQRKTEGARTSNLDDGYEVGLDSFSEESFTCTCPECGFKFNE